MKFGAYLIESPRGAAPTASIASPTFLKAYAQHAEEVGFDSLWFPDHVVIPAQYESRYPYQPPAPDGAFERYPYDEAAFPEPLIALAYAAGATERIELRTGVMILPQRNPVLLAKQAATLDALSGGRLSLGFGIGWLREEFEALGVPWERRGKRTTEYIAAMRELWTQEEASYHGETVRFDRLRCDPKPARAGGIPVVLGGHTDAAARRAGRIADGFLPLGFEGTSPAPIIATMREAAAEAGRDPGRIELSAGFGGNFGNEGLEEIQRLASEGVSHIFFFINGPTIDEAKRALEEVAGQVIGAAGG